MSRATGGDAWAATFLDTFRYVDQLGRLARRGLDVHFHNTLAASDYALIDDSTLTPRPSYWAALLWSRLMGNVVLDAGINRGDLHLYSHCLKGRGGGVALVAVNLSAENEQPVRLSRPAELFELTAPTLQSGEIALNGRKLAATTMGKVPMVKGRAIPAGTFKLAPLSVNFLSIPGANNRACSAHQS